MRVFALGLAGEIEAARSLAAARYGAVGQGRSLPPFWQWLEARYGILSSTLATNDDLP